MSRRTPFIALGFLLLLVTCRDGMEPQLQLARVAVAPVLPSERALASFGLTLDRVRFIVVRGGAGFVSETRAAAAPDTLADTTVALPPDLAALDLNLRVPLIAAAETLEVSIVALAGATPLFQGAARVEVLSGGTPAAPTEIPVLTYVGPGAGVDSLAIAPAAPFIYFKDSLRFQVQAFQSGVPVAQFYVSWGTSDSTVARVNGAGVLRAPASRSAVRIIARMPGSNVADSTTATFVPVPTQLAIISGAGQSGIVGQALATPLEVEVRAADNLPVGGVAVRFRAPTGGSPVDTTITTGLSGRAVVNAILGPAAGNQTFQVSLPAFPSVLASFTASATSTAISAATSTVTVSTGTVLSGNTVKLRLQGKDASGSDITTGGDLVVFSSSGGSTTGTISATADSGNGVYTAVFTGVLAGTGTTIGATINGIAISTALPTITVSPGSISPGTSAVTVSASTVISGDVATLRLRAKDAAGNLITTGGETVTFALSGGGSTAAITAAADSGNGVYTATLTGQAAGGPATVDATVNGNPVTSARPSVTVVPGTPAQLLFTAQPSGAFMGSALSPPVEVTARDAFGNTTPAFTGAVVMAIGTNPANGLLSGTLTQVAVAGVATFDDLVIDQGGVGYTLVASAPGLSNATSAGFDVAVPTGTRAWTNPAGGNWSNPANWNGGVVPGLTETAAITLPGTYTVTLDVNDTIAGLQLGGSSGTQTLLAASRTLDVQGAAQVNTNGLLLLKASTLTGGTLADGGKVFVEGNTAITAGVTTTSGSVVRVQGNGTYGGASLTVAAGFTNNGTIVLTDTSAAYGATLTVTSGTLTNAPGASIVADVGTLGPRALSAVLRNQGTLTLNRQLSLGKQSATHTNSGSINVAGGDLVLSQSGTSPSFTTSGAITIAGGFTMQVSGGTFDYAGGTIAGPGTLTFSSASVTLTSGLSTATIPLSITSSTIGGSGTLTVSPGTELIMRASTINAALVNQGLITATGASALNGALSNASGATLRVQGNGTYGGGNLTIATSFTNNGAIALTDTTAAYGATLTMPAGATLTNAAGATIDAATGAGGARTLTLALDNQGTVTLNRPLTLNRTNAVHSNSGTIDLSGGDLTLSQSGSASFSTSGTITVPAGRTFAVNGGAFNYSAGAISGGGTLSFSSAAVTVSQDFNTSTAAVILTSSTWGGGGIVTVSPGTLLDVRASTISAGVLNQATILVTGSSALNGTLSNPAGAVLKLQGNGTYGGAALTVANSFANSGAIVLTDTSAAYGATLTMPIGATLTNTATGTIDAAAGANGPRTLTAALDNQGTVTLTRSLTINRSAAAHLNSGTIDVSGGDLTISQSGTNPSFGTSGAITIAPSHAVNVNGAFNYTGGSISGNGTLALSNATVTAAQNFSTATAALTIASSTWGGTGVLTIAAGTTLNLRASTISAPFVNQGTLTVNGGSSLTNSVTNAAGALLRVQGNGTYGGANLTVANGLTNDGAIVLTDSSAAYGSTLGVSSGVLLNASGATIDAVVGANGSRTLSAQLDNRGTVTVAVATAQALTINKAGAMHENRGTIAINSGDLTLTQSGTTPSFRNTGAISIATGDTMRVTGGSVVHDSGTIGGAGTLSLSSVTAGAFNTAQSVAAMLVNNSTVTYATAQSTGSTLLAFTGSTVNGPGLLTNDVGETLSVRSSTINAPLDNQGTIVEAGTSTFTGSFTTAAGSLLRIQGNSTLGGAALTLANGFTNNGAIELTDTVAAYGATLNVNAGTLTNATSGSIAAVTGANGSRNLNAALDNQGTVSVALAPGRTLAINKAGAAHQNSGTIDVSAGGLTITQSGITAGLTNTGAINIATGDTLTLNGGALNHNSGTLGGAGTLVLNSVTPAAFSVAHTAAEMFVTNSTVNFATPQSTGATGFSFSGSIINGPGTLTNDPGKTLGLRTTTVNAPLANLGTLLVTGSSTFNDTLTTAGGSFLRVQGNSATGGASLTVPTGFENAGRIELTDTVAAYGASLAIAGGKLVNLPGGTIDVTAGANGSRALNAGLDNQGTLTVAMNSGHTLTMGPPAGDSVGNSGTIVINSGNLRINQSGASALTSNVAGISIAAGDTFFVVNGAFSHNGSSLDGPGALSLASVTAANFAKPHTLGAILLTSSTATFVPDQSTGTTSFDINGSTVNGPGILTNVAGNTLSIRGSSTIATALVNQGTIVAAGSSTFSGAVTQAPGSLLRVLGFSSQGAATLTVTTAGGLTNGGAIELSDSNAAYGATLKISGGPLVNAAGATIDLALGANGPRTIDAVLDNKGTLTVNRDATLSGTAPAHTNSGVMKVNGGNLTVQPAGANPTFTNQLGGSIDIGVGRTLRFTTGAVSNAAGAVIDGFGTLDVRPPGTFSNDGDLAPGGSPGTLSINAGTGAVPFSTTANYNVEIGGTTPGTQYDQLLVTGSASWAGTLNVSLIGGFTPTTGQSFILATCSATCSNRFGVTNLPAPFSGSNVSYVGNQVLLTAP